MQIRIKSTPAGDAPELVRQAWIGLVLPVPRAWSGRRKFRTVGVLSRERNREAGYAVAADRAVEILSQHAPEAAIWWRQNAPKSIARGKYFVFAEAACEVIPEPGDRPEISGVRTFSGRLLAALAGLFIIAGICSPFYADSTHKVDLGLIAAMIAIGLFLGFCAARLGKPTR